MANLKAPLVLPLGFLLLGLLFDLGSTSTDRDYFINKLFSKYGSSGVLSFEGFEHLMENLGLGKLKFEKNHTLWVHKMEDGTFKQIHESLNLHNHNYTRLKRSPPVERFSDDVSECMAPSEILAANGLTPDSSVKISHLGFLYICPTILYQLDKKACTSEQPATPVHSPKPHVSENAVWSYATMSVLLISASGLFGVLLVPILDKALFKHLISTLVALAVGTLCGDALLHLLPHAIESDDHDHSTPVLRTSTTFMTMLLFFFLEAVIHGHHGHSHHGGKKTSDVENEYSMVPPNVPDEEDNKEETVGHLVIIGDALHNLTDGLAVGAAFRADIAAGFATAVAVLTHELPHELGDFAVLLKSGMSIRKAVYFNIFSSIISFIGMAGGIYLGNFDNAAHWIYAATAGSFLYIGLADLVPELHKYRAASNSKVFCTMLQLCGAFTGGAIMFIIAMYEDSLYTMFESS